MTMRAVCSVVTLVLILGLAFATVEGVSGSSEAEGFMQSSAVASSVWGGSESVSAVVLEAILSENDGNCSCNVTDPCAPTQNSEPYDVSIHIGALFIMLGVSLFGTVLPICISRYRQHRIPAVIIKIARSFGTGVILATAFIHMLIPAVLSLTNECLGAEFSQTYTAYAGLITMLATLFVQAIEFVSTHLLEKFFSKKEEKKDDHHHAHAHSDDHPHHHHVEKHPPPDTAAESDGIEGTTDEVIDVEEKPVASVPVGIMSPDTVVHAHTHMHPHEDHEHCSHPHAGITTGKVFSADVPLTLRLRVAVLVLELGIAFHSVIVGIGLGALRGDEFRALLIALSFHQFFEGFALGATIMDADFPSRMPVVFTVVWYSLTTPIGVAIGIGIASTYSENSFDTLLVQGILDSISAGILIYTSLVELLSYQFTNNLAFRRETRLVQVTCFFALYAGAGIMAFIGRYA